MIIWFAVLAFALSFSFVLLFGAPYLPTRRKQVREALDLLNLKKGEVFVDLGSGDGAVLVEAVQRGYICYGYELNPFLWLVAKLRTFAYGKRVKIYCSNFWKIQLPEQTKGIYVFLLDKYMPKLDAKLAKELRPGACLVSYTFQIPGRKPAIIKEALYLYKY
jgi:SAM-dependent methyltransferase